MFDPDQKLKRGVAAALVVAVVGAGAAGAIAVATDGHGPTKPAAGAQPTHVTARNNSAGTVKTSTVPAGLERAESAAEDVIDYVAQGKRARARAQVRALKRLAHGSGAAELARAGVPQGKIRALQQRADRLERLSSRGAPRLEVSLAANHVSELMPSLYARYQDPVPPAVLRLDYLGREIQLRSMGGQTAQVRRLVKAEARTWSKLRPRLVAAGGAQAAHQYDAHLRALRRDQGPSAVQKQALEGLEIVDLMENAFRAM